MRVRYLIHNIRSALDVLRAAVRSDTIPPDDRVARLAAVGIKHIDDMRASRIAALGVAADLVEDLTEAGVSRPDAMRFAANELISTAAFVVRALKRAEGTEISPARFALVAYQFAVDISRLEGLEAEAGEAAANG